MKVETEQEHALVTAAMRAFEPYSSVLRYREADKWHACDIMGMREAVRSVLASLPGAGAGEPAGWKLVPVEPTAEMVRSAFGTREWIEADANTVATWRAMLAAAPASPAPASLEVASHEPAIDETQPGLSIVRDTQAPASLPSEEAARRIAEFLQLRDETLFTGTDFEADDDERTESARAVLALLSPEGT